MDPRVNVRAPGSEQEAARTALTGTAWTIQQLVQAVLRAVAHDRDAVLAVLLPYYREKRKAGRPPKNPQT